MECIALRPTEPLPLHHSWPILQRGQRFDLGVLHVGDPWRLAGSEGFAFDAGWAADSGIGLWDCDLSDNSLTWSDEVYRLFGLPPQAAITRAEAVACYREESRAAMEHLRAYAIRHRRGFTLDVEIDSVQGDRRWVRLTAAPICVDGRAVRLQGVKRDVTHNYR